MLTVGGVREWTVLLRGTDFPGLVHQMTSYLASEVGKGGGEEGGRGGSEGKNQQENKIKEDPAPPPLLRRGCVNFHARVLLLS